MPPSVEEGGISLFNSGRTDQRKENDKIFSAPIPMRSIRFKRPKDGFLNAFASQMLLTLGKMTVFYGRFVKTLWYAKEKRKGERTGMDVVRTIGLAVCALVIFLQVEQLGKRPQFMDRRERKRLAKKKRRAVRRLMVCVVVGVALVMGPETFGKMIPQTITVAEGLTLPKGEMPDWLVYYNQQDEPWGQKGYGPSDTIAVAGCGPTVLAMAVSSLTETDMNPEDMSNWAAEHGYCVPGSGSLHTLIGDGLDAFGIAYHTGNGQEASHCQRGIR